MEHVVHILFIIDLIIYFYIFKYFVDLHIFFL